MNVYAYDDVGVPVDVCVVLDVYVDADVEVTVDGGPDVVVDVDMRVCGVMHCDVCVCMCI